MKAKRGLTFILAVLMFLLCGCYSGIISEEYPNGTLAQIDPDDGIMNEKQVKLFFRVAGEGLLAAVERSVTVLAGETDEAAMVRALIESDLSQTEGIEKLIPQKTRVVDVMLDGTLLYVTLSGEFFDNSAVYSAGKDVERLVKSGILSETAANARTEAAEKETYLARRLAVQSIVNTVTANHPGISVQMLFEWNGDAVRVTRSDLGFANYADADQSLLEPLEYNGDIVAKPEDIVRCALNRLESGEYHKIYPHISKTDTGDKNALTYAAFENAVRALSPISAYTIEETVGTGDNITVYADITAAKANGSYATDRRAFVLKDDGGIYKLSCLSLLEALGGGQ